MTRPLLVVVVVVSFTTVPSGCVVVVVFVVDVVELVVTGEGGTTTGGAVLVDEQAAAKPQRVTITKANLNLIMISGCLLPSRRVKHYGCRGLLGSRNATQGNHSLSEDEEVRAASLARARLDT
jgi:hypothetical protein